MSRIGTNPFEVPVADRDVVRRLRGRLPAPVTVWTSTGDGIRAGLTISSALIVEGEPPQALGLVGDLTDLWIAIGRSKRFIVHVLDETQSAIADDFAGRRPGPDAPFGILEVADTEWGPEIRALPTHAYCTFIGFLEVGYSLLVAGTIDHIDIGATDGPPLVHYRGRYENLHKR